MAVNVEDFKARFEELKREKQTMIPLYQLIAEYADPTKANFNGQTLDGESYNDHLFDTTATKAGAIAASAMIGLLWPNGGNSVILEPEHPELEDDKDAQDWFDFVNKRLRLHLDDPRANLDNTLDEYMLENLHFGTSGIMLDEGNKAMFSSRALSIQNIYIDEDEDGFCDTVFMEYERTVRVLVLEYGIEKVSQKVRDLFKAKQFGDKIKMIYAIYPRTDRDHTKSGNDNMPYASVHMEWDSGFVVRESGYNEFPCPVGRYRKKVNQKYGTSAGMDALPDILEINDVKESLNIAREKTLDPPLLVQDDGKMGGGVIDTSSGAINVVRVSGRAGNQAPISPLMTVGDLGVADTQVGELQNSIMGHYKIDRLLDLNNETEMTLGEAQIRDKMRADALRSIIGRQISEVFTPLVERAFAILFRKGELGVARGTPEEAAQIALGRTPVYIPESVLKFAGKSERVYRVKYLTPAARMMETQEATAVIELWQAAAQIAGVLQDPSCLDYLDPDESLKVIQRVRGAPSKVIRENDAVKKIRDARDQAAQEQAQIQQAGQMAQVAAQAGQAQAIQQQVQ